MTTPMTSSPVNNGGEPPSARGTEESLLSLVANEGQESESSLQIVASSLSRGATMPTAVFSVFPLLWGFLLDDVNLDNVDANSSATNTLVDFRCVESLMFVSKEMLAAFHTVNGLEQCQRVLEAEFNVRKPVVDDYMAQCYPFDNRTYFNHDEMEQCHSLMRDAPRMKRLVGDMTRLVKVLRLVLEAVSPHLSQQVYLCKHAALESANHYFWVYAEGIDDVVRLLRDCIYYSENIFYSQPRF